MHSPIFNQSSDFLPYEYIDFCDSIIRVALNALPVWLRVAAGYAATKAWVAAARGSIFGNFRPCPSPAHQIP